VSWDVLNGVLAILMAMSPNEQRDLPACNDRTNIRVRQAAFHRVMACKHDREVLVNSCDFLKMLPCSGSHLFIVHVNRAHDTFPVAERMIDRKCGGDGIKAGWRTSIGVARNDSETQAALVKLRAGTIGSVCAPGCRCVTEQQYNIRLLGLKPTKRIVKRRFLRTASSL
jgi:hypothetical protein